MRDLLQHNLNQDFDDFPFLHLSPEVEDTDASNYWWRKRNFRTLSEQLGRRLGSSAGEMRRALSKSVAILELCPYRSERFHSRMVDLPSARLALDALQEALTEARETSNRAFVTPWNCAVWQPDRHLSEPYFRNAPDQSFSFKCGAKAGFGEVIARQVFGVAVP